MTPDTPIACTLDADELPERLEHARELGARALVGVEVADRRALLRFDGEREHVEVLVATESRCCPFFSFDVGQDGEVVELEIVTPEAGVPVLRSLVAGIVAGWNGGIEEEARR